MIRTGELHITKTIAREMVEQVGRQWIDEDLRDQLMREVGSRIADGREYIIKLHDLAILVSQNTKTVEITYQATLGVYDWQKCEVGEHATLDWLNDDMNISKFAMDEKVFLHVPPMLWKRVK